MTKAQILEIFSMVLTAGSSDTYSVSIDYDTEFGYLDIWFWRSLTRENVDMVRHVSNRRQNYEEILKFVKDCVILIVADRAEKKAKDNESK